MHRLLVACLAVAALPAAAQEAYSWQYARHVAESPLDTALSLIFGLPESDGIQAHALCTIGANWIYADVTLEADVSGHADGALVPLTITGEGYEGTFTVEVVRYEIGLEGVIFALALDDPLWTALMGLSEVYYALPGRAETPLLLEGLAPLAHEFLGDCLSIVDLTPDPAAAQAPSAGK